jgi:hypothetical protein
VLVRGLGAGLGIDLVQLPVQGGQGRVLADQAGRAGQVLGVAVEAGAVGGPGRTAEGQQPRRDLRAAGEMAASGGLLRMACSPGSALSAALPMLARQGAALSRP